MIFLQIKFFHTISNFSAPETDSEKLIWNVLEAERRDIRLLFISRFPVMSCISTEFVTSVPFLPCSHVHEKSLLEVNNSFLEKHKGSALFNLIKHLSF